MPHSLYPLERIELILSRIRNVFGWVPLVSKSYSCARAGHCAFAGILSAVPVF